MEELSKSTFFITGITGFTGKHLEKYLIREGYSVYGSTLSNSSNKNHYICDILNEESLFKVLKKVKPNYVIHLAAISYVATTNQQNIYNINVFGTLNLLQAIEKLDYVPSKILIASSAAVYGNVEGELGETMCPQPVNHYGNSKLVMENMVKAYFSKLNIIITRPFNYTGVGQEAHFLIPKIIAHYKQGKKEIELGNIDVYREFNDVNFVIGCYLRLIFSEFKSEVFNVCSGKAINIKTILRMMNDMSNCEMNVVINPKFVRKNEITILKGNPKKLFNCIGNFTNISSLKETLIEMYSAK